MVPFWNNSCLVCRIFQLGSIFNFIHGNCPLTHVLSNIFLWTWFVQYPSTAKKKWNWFCMVPFRNNSCLVCRIFQLGSIFKFIHYILQYFCAKFYACNKKCTMFSIFCCKTRRILYFSCSVYFGTYRTPYIGVCMSYIPDKTIILDLHFKIDKTLQVFGNISGYLEGFWLHWSSLLAMVYVTYFVFCPKQNCATTGKLQNWT